MASEKLTRCTVSLHQISPRTIQYSNTAFATPFPSYPGISNRIDRRSEGLLMARNRRRTRKKQPNHGRRMSFEFRCATSLVSILVSIRIWIDHMHGGKMEMEAWQSLVYVCRRWRCLVFGSPRRLNLQLFCTPKTPAKDRLDVWPALPLIIAGNKALSSGTDNIIAALWQTNRLADWRLKKRVLAALEVPYSIPGADRAAALVGW